MPLDLLSFPLAVRFSNLDPQIELQPWSFICSPVALAFKEVRIEEEAVLKISSLNLNPKLLNLNCPLEH